MALLRMWRIYSWFRGVCEHFNSPRALPIDQEAQYLACIVYWLAKAEVVDAAALAPPYQLQLLAHHQPSTTCITSLPPGTTTQQSRPPRIASAAAMLGPRTLFASPTSPLRICTRCASNARTPTRPIPPPTPFIPDVPTFLKVIGRGLSAHVDKIPSWEALFRMKAEQFRKIGIEPPRTRRYLLWWREKFRVGDFGVGGDLTEVTDGVAEVRVFEVPVKGWYKPLASATTSEGTKKIAVNVPLGEERPSVDPALAAPVKYVKIRYDHTICGAYFEPVKGTDGHVARIRVTEGMWEQKRGRKIDGGERRRAEVRSKKAAAARKAALKQ